MHPLTEKGLRAAFINTTVRERAAITPPSLDDIDWASLDVLAWRDPRVPANGLVLVELDDEPVGVQLRQAEVSPRSRAQCSWCADVTLPNDVVFFSARRAGKRGRDGNTLGTLLCSRFECAVNVRRLPPSAYLGYDVEAARRDRIAALAEHARTFVRRVRGDL